MTLYLDTHAVVLLGVATRRLPKRAVSLIRRASELMVSPATVLELQVLQEIGRLAVPARDLLAKVAEALPLAICEKPFSRVVMEATKFGWTRDPFDRLIVAQASLGDSVLLTKDEKIRGNYTRARWD